MKIGYAEGALTSAIQLAKLSVASGARSIVCSPFEAGEIRSVVGSEISIITPGVRPEGSALGDQKRVMTPAQAIATGASYLVIGRPITDLSKVSLDAMREGAAKILASIK